MVLKAPHFFCGQVKNGDATFSRSISVFRGFACTVIHAETPEIADENGLQKAVSKVKHFETVFKTPRENNGTLFYLKNA